MTPEYGFGRLSERVPAIFANRWDELRPRIKQVHGIAVVEARAPGETLGEADAIWTREPGLAVGVMTADCVPVLLWRADGRAVGAVHAGWRGTKARILRAFFETLARQGERPSDWQAAIGPAIGPCCYEVNEELAAEFARDFGPSAVPKPRHLDLQTTNEAELRGLGVKQIEVVRSCTKCTLGSSGAPVFHSYRREGGGTRPITHQWSVIRVCSA